MNFVSFVFVSFFFPYWVFGKKWNGTDKNKQTNKQSILEAAHRDHEMVIEAFPIWGGGVQYSEYSDILKLLSHVTETY